MKIAKGIELNPYHELVITSIVWGTAGLFVRYLDLPSTTLAFFRMAVPTVIFFFVLIFRKFRLFRGSFMILLMASLINAVRSFLYFVGYNNTSIGNATILLNTGPVFAAVLGYFFLHEEMGKKKALLIASAFVGVVVLYLGKEISFANRDFIGMLAIVASTFLYAVTVVIFKKVSGYSRAEKIFYQNFAGLFIFLPFMFLNPLPPIEKMAVASIYAFLMGVVGFGLFFSAIRSVDISTATFITYIEILVAMLIGILVFKEHLTVNMVLGGIIIAGSVVMISRLENGKHAKKA